MKKINIDKNIYEFFVVTYFGSGDDIFDLVTNRAYLDLNRTIRFNGLPEVYRDLMKKKVAIIIRNEILELFNLKQCNQIIYDNWHLNLCEKIKSVYKSDGVDFHLGQSQKWINMTMKYLYVLNDDRVNQLLKYLHVAVDNYIIEYVCKFLSFSKPKIAWSRQDNYDEYLNLQEKIREISFPDCPFFWEMYNWNKMVVNK